MNPTDPQSHVDSLLDAAAECEAMAAKYREAAQIISNKFGLGKGAARPGVSPSDARTKAAKPHQPQTNAPGRSEIKSRADFLEEIMREMGHPAKVAELIEGLEAKGQTGPDNPAIYTVSVKNTLKRNLGTRFSKLDDGLWYLAEADTSED